MADVCKQLERVVNKTKLGKLKPIKSPKKNKKRAENLYVFCVKKREKV